MTHAMRASTLVIASVSAVLALAGAPAVAATKVPLTADEFVAQLNRDLASLASEQQTAAWVQDTYITQDTELLAAKANERLLAYISEAASQAQRYAGEPLKPDTGRSLKVRS